jgi:hypothetical protein
VPLAVLKPTQQELICAHGTGDLPMDPAEEDRCSTVQESDYSLTDAEGRITTIFNKVDGLATFADQLREWMRNLPATELSVV